MNIRVERSLEELEKVLLPSELLERLSAYRTAYDNALEKLMQNGHQLTEEEIAGVRDPLMKEFNLIGSLSPGKNIKK